MAGQNGGFTTITVNEIEDRVDEQISKLRFILATLAGNTDPLEYEGAMTGMYFILEGAIDDLEESFEALYPAALEGEKKRTEERSE